MREVVLPTGWKPYSLAAAAGGALWMTLVEPGGLARLDTLELHPTAGRPMQAAAALGELWYTTDADTLGRVHPPLTVDLPAGSAPYGVDIGLDGSVWFTAPGRDRLGRRAPDGTVTYVDLPEGSYAAMLAVTADGAVWAALNRAGALARWDGELRIIPAPTAPVGVAADGDGVWFADIAGGAVGFADPSGAVRRFAFDEAGGVPCRPHAVAADPDGGCWATLWGSGELARVSPDGAIERTALPGSEPHGLIVADGEVWVAMESGSLVSVART